MSYPNSLMKLCLCLVVFLFRNIANFGNFWSNFCIIHSSYWFYDHFFAWNHGTQICFICETQKYSEKWNNIWMITFYVGILACFGNFWANICGQVFSFRITQKIVPVWKYYEKFCLKLTKIAKFEVNLEYQGKFWTNWMHNK